MITPEQRQAAAEEILEELHDGEDGAGSLAGTAFAIVHRLLSPQSVAGNLIRAEALRDAAEVVMQRRTVVGAAELLKIRADVAIAQLLSKP